MAPEEVRPSVTPPAVGRLHWVLIPGPTTSILGGSQLPVGPGISEKVMKQQATSIRLRHFVAGHFGKWTEQQASSNKPRQFVKCFKPGLRVKNRFHRKR